MFFLLIIQPRIKNNNKHPRHYRHIGHIKYAGLKDHKIDMHKIGYRAVYNAVVQIAGTAAYNEDDTQQPEVGNIGFIEYKAKAKQNGYQRQ